jgi:outer membrane protein
MKNITNVLTGLLLIAVAYLLFAHFRGTSVAASGGDAAPISTSPKIVFVNGDTLLKQYKSFQLEMENLEKEGKAAESNLQKRVQALQSEYIKVQQRVQQGQMAPSQIQAEEQRLTQRQQSLGAEQERMSKIFLEKKQKIQEQLEKEIKTQLTALRKEKGYDFILNYGPGSGVLMVNDSLDITKTVLQRLNDKIEKQN